MYIQSDGKAYVRRPLNSKEVLELDRQDASPAAARAIQMIRVAAYNKAVKASEKKPRDMSLQDLEENLLLLQQSKRSPDMLSLFDVIDHEPMKPDDISFYRNRQNRQSHRWEILHGAVCDSLDEVICKGTPKLPSVPVYGWKDQDATSVLGSWLSSYEQTKWQACTWESLREKKMHEAARLIFQSDEHEDTDYFKDIVDGLLQYI